MFTKIYESLRLNKSEESLLSDLLEDEFKKNNVSLFLDGLDEISEKNLDIMTKKINEFLDSVFSNNNVIITTRPYTMPDINQMQKMEISPFNQSQIHQFISHYYKKKDFAERFLSDLKTNNTLMEIAKVPILLVYAIGLYQRNKTFTNKINLYEDVVQNLVDTLDYSKSVKRQFKISLPQERLRFLRHLAFSRLFHDEGKFEKKITFSVDDLLYEADQYCEKKKKQGKQDDYVEDVIGMPMLREVGHNVYAFSHLTIQEYLAAQGLVERSDCIKLFCKEVFKPICDMEVLPMALGMLKNADEIYKEIEFLPESFDYSNLKLRIRGIAYSAKISDNIFVTIINNLISFIKGREIDVILYLEIITQFFRSYNEYYKERLVVALIEILQDKNTNSEVRRSVAITLGLIGSEKAVDPLIEVIQDSDEEIYVTSRASRSLESIKKNILAIGLFKGLSYKNNLVRQKVISVIGYYLHDEKTLHMISDIAQNDPDENIKK